MERHVLPTGISVVYQPSQGEAIVDIVLVHGLHGHPYKSWLSTSAPPPSGPMAPGNVLRRALSTIGIKSTRAFLNHSVFWPADLLPSRCPQARVLVFGYDSKITKYTSGAPNKNSLLAHSRDLLYALGRERRLDRPLIFIAHSFGGIIIKEMLSGSSTSTESELQNIIKSAAAVVFLGTPHRGSSDLSAFGEYARSFVSHFRMETNASILDALGLKTTDLERAQEAFSRLWHTYDFRVKTFQEGLPLTGIRLGILGNKVVPDYSSSLGDHRERAETLQANHKEMCRFTGFYDVNFLKVAGELHLLYESLKTLHTNRSRPHPWLSPAAVSVTRNSDNANVDKGVNDRGKASLQSLWFPGMYSRVRSLGRPAPDTCTWLFDHELYQHWSSNQEQDTSCGMLCLKGHPGAGKSVIMGEAFRRAVELEDSQQLWAIGVFYNARGGENEHSPTGAFRSLLHQLLPRYPHGLEKFSKLWEEKFGGSFNKDDKNIKWTMQELSIFFRDLVVDGLPKRLVVFVDALDECDSEDSRLHAQFWRQLTIEAFSKGSNLIVCLSIRHFPNIDLHSCTVIVVDDNNHQDIRSYIDQRLVPSKAITPQQFESAKTRIMERASGSFLWTDLMVTTVLQRWNEGMTAWDRLDQSNALPRTLNSLYNDLLTTHPEPELARKLFFWVVFSVKPLRAYEWSHILAFLQEPVPSSLAEWRNSDRHTSNIHMLSNRITTISRGLVEMVKLRPGMEVSGLDSVSVDAGPGSLNLDEGETCVVQVIHETVREFFLRGRGFKILRPISEITDSYQTMNKEQDTVGKAHLSIMVTCLKYLSIVELDALVKARRRHNGIKPEHNDLSGEGLDDAVSLSRKQPDPSAQTRLAGDDEEKSLASSSNNRRYLNENQLKELEDNFSKNTSDGVNPWLEATSVAFQSIHPKPLSTLYSAHSSCSRLSQTLEDYPALLSYATQEFFTHARLAEDQGVDPESVVDLMRDSWERWKALKEDIPKHVSLYQYVSLLGLSSWTSILEDMQVGISLQDQAVAWERDSVASFSSAGSHKGSGVG